MLTRLQSLQKHARLRQSGIAPVHLSPDTSIVRRIVPLTGNFMKNVCLVALTAAVALVFGCSREPSPTSPSRQSPAASGLGITAVPSASVFGASAVDFAGCLQGAADAACMSGARFSAHAATGAAATLTGTPLNLSGSSSGSTVTLNWSAPIAGDPVTTYVIEAGSSTGLSNLANFSTGNTLTAFSASGIGAGSYYVRVRALNASGMTSAASNEWILIVGGTFCTAPPGAPSALSATPTGSTVSLAWTAPASAGCPATSYLLQAGSSPGLSNLANSNVGNTTSYVASGVGNGIYYVRVRASNAFGQSAPSNEFTLTVGTAAPPVPTANDVQPRTVDFGRQGGCPGGVVSQRFDITAPPDVTWTASAVGSSYVSWAMGALDKSSGTGTGSVTWTVTMPRYTSGCNLGLSYSYGDTITVYFRRGSTVLNWIAARATYTLIS
jgi:hypothetical protein